MAERAKEKRGLEYYTQLPYSILLHRVEDEGDKYWMAEIPELPGCRSHGSTVEEAVASVEKAKNDWIADSLDAGESVPVPVDREMYSGKTLVRMSRSLHRALSLMADSEKLSLNQLIVTMLAKEVGRLNVLNRAEDKMDRLLKRVEELVERDEQEAVGKTVRLIAEQTELRGRYWVNTGYPIEVPEVGSLRIQIADVAGTVSPFEESVNFLCQQVMRQPMLFGGLREIRGESRDEVSIRK